jgi:hypothetical protein
MKTRLYLDVEFNGRKTDAESMATAMDKVAKEGLTDLRDCWDEYGEEPKVGQFLVLNTEAAAEHAEALDALIDGRDDDELGKMLALVRDFLRNIARM